MQPTPIQVEHVPRCNAGCVGDSHRLLSDDDIRSRIGLCTHCGAVEVVLIKVTGIRDLSDIGESSTYPTGYGCEVCA